jgi:hypothetical protein
MGGSGILNQIGCGTQQHAAPPPLLTLFPSFLINGKFPPPFLLTYNGPPSTKPTALPKSIKPTGLPVNQTFHGPHGIETVANQSLTID